MFVDLELALGRLKSLVGFDDLYQLLKAYMHESQENWIAAPEWTVPLTKHLAALDGIRGELNVFFIPDITPPRLRGGPCVTIGPGMQGMVLLHTFVHKGGHVHG